LASDISSIIQNELTNTFDSLLSLQSSVQSINKLEENNISSENHVKIDSSVSFSGDKQSNIVFYLPTLIATKFEFFMLGEIGDVKEEIDDEIVDATKEIIATVGGGLSTTINAQGFDDINSFSFTLNNASNIPSSDVDFNSTFEFKIKLNDDEFSLYIQFDDNLLVFLNSINSGNEIIQSNEDENNNSHLEVNPNLDALLSILGENSSDNLKLLFDVKLKFSVRLGTKTFLLKDIVNWDVGQIIELEQMVNEPLDILINNIKVGVGEAVIVDGKFGIKVKYIGEDN